ncbi:unnamed protein product, partial [Didymodactylos carnosus]
MCCFSALESLGLIEQKLNVHAQEDVYSMTMTKKKTSKSNPQPTPPSRQLTPTTSTMTGNGNSQNNNNTSTSGVSERPLRERLIHLLAVRGYKKPELIIRLKL